MPHTLEKEDFQINPESEKRTKKTLAPIIVIALNVMQMKSVFDDMVVPVSEAVKKYPGPVEIPKDEIIYLKRNYENGLRKLEDLIAEARKMMADVTE